MPIFSVIKLRVHPDILRIMGDHVNSCKNPELKRRWHQELEIAKVMVEEVFAKDGPEGWEGWPAEWSPQVRTSSPIITYPHGAWVKVKR